MRTPGKRERTEIKEDVPSAGGAIASSSDLKAGDRVVYPKQGVYRVTGLEQKDIAGQRLEFVKMTREQDGASVLVPLGKVATIGLRRVASADDIAGVFHYLGASYDDPELDWKVRHRDNVERLIAGGVLGVAEVVKGLHSLSRLRPLPAKERELYDSSRHLLVNEISVALGVPDVIAEDYIDYALMPPAGVKLPLKTPPTPVELKGPPWKRKKVAAAEEEDDLGLAELGIDLGALEGAGVGDSEESEEGESEGEKSSEEGAEEAAVPAKTAPAAKAPPAKAPPPVKAPAPAAAKAAPPPKGAPVAKSPPPAKVAPAAKKPPAKAPPPAPAKKPAPAPAKKPVPAGAKKAPPAAKKPAPKKAAPAKAAPAKKPAAPAKGKKK